jgi:hypothetical protein
MAFYLGTGSVQFGELVQSESTQLSSLRVEFVKPK